jgi:EmrB/QacA subfamily drug resistance transporter
MSGFGLFVVGSALCGLSPNEYVLVAFRGFQALGAAMLFAAAPAILTTNFPPQHRGQVMGLQGTFTYLGLTVGPPLGALLAARFGWPAIFYINVPVGLVALFISWRFIPADSGSGSGERFDVPGAVTFLAGLSALVLALNNGSEWGWTSLPVVGLLVGAVAVLAAFVAIERRRESPLMDLSLFANRTFSTSTVAALLNYVSIYTVVFLMPSYLEQGRGLPLPKAGFVLMAMPLVMAIMAPLSGSLSDRIGTRLPVIAGMVVLAAGLVALGLVGPTAPLPLVALVMAVIGLGVGAFVSPNTSALMGAAPPHRRGIASGILAEARNVGMVLGVALAGAVFTSVLHGTSPGPNPVTFRAISSGLFVAAGVAAVGAVLTATAKKPPSPAE